MLTAHNMSVGFRSAKSGNVQTFIGTPGKRLANIIYAVTIILFILLAMYNAKPTIVQARVTAGANSADAEDMGMHYDSATKSWTATNLGESHEDGVIIPETAMNGTNTVGSLIPTYTYWAGDSHRCGIICYVIDLSTNKVDTAYKPFIIVNNLIDSNNDKWRSMVNTAKFQLRTGDYYTLSEVSVREVQSIAPVLWNGSAWSSNEGAVEGDLLGEDATYTYKMLKYWARFGNVTDKDLQDIAKKSSQKKAALAFETVSAQSFFSSTDPNSVARITGGYSKYGDYNTVSSPRAGEAVRCFTTEYGFAKQYGSKGISGLSGSVLNWKWFQATAGSMILQESEAGITVPSGNTSIGSISSSEASTRTNGYGIIMTHISLPPIHTYGGSTPGNTENPDPPKDGKCTIKKLYYTEVLNPDGTIAEAEKDKHKFSRSKTTNYISVDNESGYVLEGWKASSKSHSLNSKRDFKSIGLVNQQGTSSSVITIGAQDNLYVLIHPSGSQTAPRCCFRDRFSCDQP